MRQIASNYKIKTILALAHPDDHPLSVSERTRPGAGHSLDPHPHRRSAQTRPIPRRCRDLLDDAAAVLADPANYPIFFHCHHGLNRASMAQIAYRTKYCGWTLDQATDEIARTVGLVKVTHGPDYRHMVDYYNRRVLPLRNASRTQTAMRPRSGCGPAAAPTVSPRPSSMPPATPFPVRPSAQARHGTDVPPAISSISESFLIPGRFLLEYRTDRN